ncbi:MAG: FAD:protein FMN transferase [Candidatus Moraniibacteriota bacterium]|jgi:FAD:protein FMN transferase
MTQEYNYHTEVMGCNFDMTFIAESTVQADSYFTQAVAIAKLYEDKFSRFDHNSELSFINRSKSANVSVEFLEVYEIAYNLYEKTQKRFNPLMQVARIGYDKSFEKITDVETDNINDTNYNINLNEVTILTDRFILQDSQKLDFGGFLKGYVAQKIAQKMESSGGIIINIGGDMYVRGKDYNDEKFIIEIIHPLDKTKNISVIIENEAVCTSGTYKRRWGKDGKVKHHILNTDTKDSTKTDVISASVIHRDGSVADAYATLAITLGSQKVRQFFDKQQIKFVIICENGDILKSDKFK